MKDRMDKFRVLPLALFVIILLIIRLSGFATLDGCAIMPATTPFSSGEATMPAAFVSPAAPSGAPTANPSPTATWLPSPPPSSNPNLPSTAATTAATTVVTTAAASAVTASAADIQTLPNTRLGWSYLAGTPPGHDQPAAIPLAARKLADHYAVIWQMPESGRKVVYLTIDEGYEYQNHTASILDTAKAKAVPVTFFITGSYLDHNRDLVLRMVSDGHRVANHTVTHPDLPELANAGGEAAVLGEIRNLEHSFRTLTGQDMAPLVRPPAGAYSERVLAILDRAGYRAAFWSFAYRDWLTDEQPEPTAARQKILDQLHSGSVILLHAVSATNVTILPELIDAIRARGYDFAPLGAD